MLIDSVGAVTVSEIDFEIVVLAESVTLIDSVNDPAVVGVPLMVPAAFNVSPGGREVEGVHVYGAEPPEAVKTAEYGEPTSAGGSDAVTMLKAVPVTDTANRFEVRLPGLTTLIGTSPVVVVKLAGTKAVSCVGLTYEVERALPVQVT